MFPQQVKLIQLIVIFIDQEEIRAAMPKYRSSESGAGSSAGSALQYAGSAAGSAGMMASSGGLGGVMMMQPQMSVAGMMQPQVVDAASQLQMLQQQQLQQQQLQQLRPGLMPGMVPGLPMQQLVPAVSSVGMIPGMAVPGIPGLAAQPQVNK